ncbi:MAG: GvpL/GvpF family gas vesicle protein [Drouetiella hepatica Uher 2000/2452]|jgi:hypothetical protein|uniref:GvpL/GvpF family gas vesicle protein n=1 Tax=Drouetiella hepatica Uher 2000/2452 TaxID=904376 RepID=A0A951QES4_9CYAN|nr:GvpL/GvpF family gas vesicle protein [Drouetiella hepatica Uher 2000/2452]
MLYTYAFLPNLPRSLELPFGIAAAVELLQVDDLAAIVEPHLAAETLHENDDRLMQAVVAHDRVIRQMFQQTSLLPLRFGTQFVSRQGLVEHLEAHQSDYVAKLERFEGRAEYLLKLASVSLVEAPIAPDLKGKQYFLAKKEAYQAQVDWQQQQQIELQAIAEAIAGQYSDWVRGDSGAAQGDALSKVERFYILGDRVPERWLYEQLSVWQRQHSAWEISLEAPLPPYHFV